MEEKIGRETLQELIKLQISILDKYKELLGSPERTAAKRALSNAITAAIAAIGPLLTVGHLAYDRFVVVHQEAVEQTRSLLQKLLDEEKARAEIHNKMREQAERRDRQK
jgi:hypothetical protein